MIECLKHKIPLEVAPGSNFLSCPKCDADWDRLQELAKGCHRSHPHENMDEACKLKTKEITEKRKP